MKYVADKDHKPFCADLKNIYQAPTEEKVLNVLERVTEKWSKKYPDSTKSWKQNLDAISPIFKFSVKVRKSYTPQIQSRAWMLPTANLTGREASFLAILHY